MTDEDLVTRLFRLWDDVPDGDEAALAAFRELYTDPVLVNGAEMTVAELVLRARTTTAALLDRRTEVLSVVSTADRTAVAFRLHGRHVGPVDTPLGPVRGSGDSVSLQVIDVLTLRGGRIAEIWMVADWLGLLAREGAVRLATDEPTGPASSLEA